MSRGIAMNRHNSLRKAIRKYNIVKHVYWDGADLADHLVREKGLHFFSKGKIHCSCPICSTKTKKDGYKHSDIKKLEKLAYDLEESGVVVSVGGQK